MTVASRAPASRPPGSASAQAGSRSTGLAKLPKSVECIAFEVGSGRYRAICIDFSLVAESTVSVLDAQNRLGEQIVDYVLDVIDEDFPPHLLNRRMSRFEYLKFRLGIALDGLQSFGCALLAMVLPCPLEVHERAAWKQPIAGVTA